jgi:ATP-binding cassette subfamily B (MDR/TAP) protein 1
VASFSKKPTQEQIEEAAKLANAHDFIMEFPGGYDTLVGDLGSQLSGGQKQRIAIARVLLRRPKILLLDEATSALDSESERTVQRALDNLLSKDSSLGQSQMTTLVVAHRLSTIKVILWFSSPRSSPSCDDLILPMSNQNADAIAVVDQGKIVEIGTHNELMNLEGGGYRALVTAQQSLHAPSDNGNSDQSNQSNIDNTGKRISVFVPKDHTSLADKGNELVLRDVWFQYPTRPDTSIFCGINLAVKKGETLALVGPSGQGKSTIMQLIERYYEPTQGSISFEGRDLKDLNIQYYRNQISLVSQEPTLFNDTIMANIKYGKPDATDEQVYEAAKKANAHSFIQSFPLGYNTHLGETSLAVSGGQKQRIAIARAIIKEPRVLLLDEATSALDTASERVVQEALDVLMQDHSRTTIVIAHRLSTIKNADRIAYISDGKVREVGTHNELMANPESKYRQLQELQDMTRDLDEKKHEKKDAKVKKKTFSKSKTSSLAKLDEDEEEMETKKKFESKARLLAKDDIGFFAVGSFGAIMAGLMFPGWGIIFAYMIEYLYFPVFPCDEAAGIGPISPYTSCDDYIASVTDTMKNISLNLTYGWLGVIDAVLIGDILVFYGFGTASGEHLK